MFSRDVASELHDRFENWQVFRQQCCRSACQISRQNDNFNTQCRGFDTSRDITIKRPSIKWQRLFTFEYMYVCMLSTMLKIYDILSLYKWIENQCTNYYITGPVQWRKQADTWHGCFNCFATKLVRSGLSRYLPIKPRSGKHFMGLVKLTRSA